MDSKEFKVESDGCSGLFKLGLPYHKNKLLRMSKWQKLWNHYAAYMGQQG